MFQAGSNGFGMRRAASDGALLRPQVGKKPQQKAIHVDSSKWSKEVVTALLTRVRPEAYSRKCIKCNSAVFPCACVKEPRVPAPRVLREVIKASRHNKSGAVTDMYHTERSRLGVGDGSHHSHVRIVICDAQNCQKDAKNAILDRHGYIRRRVGDQVQVCLDETPRGHRVRKEMTPEYSPHRSLRHSQTMKVRGSESASKESNPDHSEKYQDCNLASLQNSCRSRMLDPSGSKFQLIRRLCKDDEALGNERGTVINCRLASDAGDKGLGDQSTDLDSTLPIEASPVVQLRLENHAEMGKSELHLDQVLFVFRRNPNLVAQILRSIPHTPKHGNVGKDLLAEIRAIDKLLQGDDHTTEEGKSMEDAVQEATNLCEELTHLIELDDVEEFAILATSNALKQLRYYSSLLAVEQWLNVTPSITCLQFMMRRLQAHCSDEYTSIYNEVRNVQEHVKAKLNRIVTLGIPKNTLAHSSGVETSKLAAREDLSAIMKITVLLLALVPDLAPEDYDKSDAFKAQQIADSLRRHDDGMMLERQGFIFAELIALCCQMPKIVLDQIIEGMANEWIMKTKGLARDARSQMLELHHVMTSFTQFGFTDNEQKFSAQLGKLQNVISKVEMVQQLPLKQFEKYALQWWLLRMCRFLIHPYRSHKSRMLRDVFAKKANLLEHQRRKAIHASSNKDANEGKHGKARWSKVLYKTKPAASMHTLFFDKVQEANTLEQWRNAIRHRNEVEDSSDEDEENNAPAAGGSDSRKSRRLDGRLDYPEFETLLMSSGGGAYGCDRLKMRALFDSMDSCGEGSVSLAEVLDITLTFAGLCEAVNAQKQSKQSQEETRREAFNALTRDDVRVYIKKQLLEKEQKALDSSPSNRQAGEESTDNDIDD